MYKTIVGGLQISPNIRHLKQLDVKLWSHDVNNHKFIFEFYDENGIRMNLDSTFSSKVVCDFQTSHSQTQHEASVVGNTVEFEFNQNLITIDEKVTAYVYLYHADKSADVSMFTFYVALSAIDKATPRMKQVYSESFQIIKDQFEKDTEQYMSVFYENDVFQIINKVNDHVSNIENPHGVTKEQIGLGNVRNVAQASQVDFNGHVTNSDNPHRVTKTQVGLGLVDDVKQAAKVDFDNHVANTQNPHSVTKSQVGLGNVTNDKQATEVDFNNHVEDISNPHGVTKAQVGLSNLDNVKQATKVEFDAHVHNTTNPHNVTKSQIGLGNIQNFPVATQDEVNTGAAEKYVTTDTIVGAVKKISAEMPMGEELLLKFGSVAAQVVTSDGTFIHDQSGASNTMIVPIKSNGGETLQFTKTGDVGLIWRIGFFDKDMKFISRVTNGALNFSQVVPAGTRFIYVSFPINRNCSVKRIA